MDYSFSTETVLVVLLIGLLLLIGLIWGLKKIYQHRSSTDLRTKYKGYNWASPLDEIHQYPDVNVFNLNGVFVKLGVVLSLGLVIIAFNWTTYEKIQYSSDSFVIDDDDITVEMPRTTELPPPPPPITKAVVFEEVKVVMMEEKEEPEFEDQSVDAETVVDRPEPVHEKRKEKVKNVSLPPPPSPPPPEVEAEIFKVVEEMPRFDGCEAVKNKEERNRCAQQKMLVFIRERLKYPAIARENGIQGNVVVSFVVERDGAITDVKIVRDIGGGCGEEAVKVVQSMPKWMPGKQRGRPVRVQFYLPVKFILA